MRRTMRNLLVAGAIALGIGLIGTPAARAAPYFGLTIGTPGYYGYGYPGYAPYANPYVYSCGPAFAPSASFYAGVPYFGAGYGFGGYPYYGHHHGYYRAYGNYGHGHHHGHW